MRDYFFVVVAVCQWGTQLFGVLLSTQMLEMNMAFLFFDCLLPEHYCRLLNSLFFFNLLALVALVYFLFKLSDKATRNVKKGNTYYWISLKNTYNTYMTYREIRHVIN